MEHLKLNPPLERTRFFFWWGGCLLLPESHLISNIVKKYQKNFIYIGEFKKVGTVRKIAPFKFIDLVAWYKKEHLRILNHWVYMICA